MPGAAPPSWTPLRRSLRACWGLAPRCRDDCRRTPAIRSPADSTPRLPRSGASAEFQAKAPRPTSWPARTASAVAPASTGPERAEGDQQAKIGLTEVSAVLGDCQVGLRMPLTRRGCAGGLGGWPRQRVLSAVSVSCPACGQWWAGMRWLLLVVGDAGVGKTRLVTEGMRRVAVDGVRHHLGRMPADARDAAVAAGGGCVGRVLPGRWRRPAGGRAGHDSEVRPG